jgi:thiamine transport system permease protein
VILLVGDSLADIRKVYLPSAATLGASPLTAALTILFPTALPSLLAASLLCFLYSFTSFAVVLVLGGGPAATTLAVEIYRYARLSLDYGRAGTLAILETLISACAFIGFVCCSRLAPREHSAQLLATNFGKPRPLSPGGIIARILYSLVIILFVLGPLLSVPLESLLWRPSRAALPLLSFRWWGDIAGRVLPALGRSLLTALLASTAACLLAVPAGAGGRQVGTFPVPGRLMRILTTLPLASSGIVLGFGWLILYGRNYSRTLPALVLLHAVTALPFAANSIAEGLEAIPRNTLNAGAVFGAGPLRRILTLELPLAWRRIRSAWAFGAVISLGELNGIMMLGMDSWETLPVLIYRAAGAYRYGMACVAGTVLILCCLGIFMCSGDTSKENNGAHNPRP